MVRCVVLPSVAYVWLCVACCQVFLFFVVVCCRVLFSMICLCLFAIRGSLVVACCVWLVCCMLVVNCVLCVVWRVLFVV